MTDHGSAVAGVPTVSAGPATSAERGRLVWSPVKSVWITSVFAIALLAGPATFSWSAFAVFLGLSAVTLCLGHSLGMHRLMIHRSYACSRALEYLLVHLGTLVGISGPLGMMRAHDLRDWAQRQRRCHAFFSQRATWWVDSFRQLHLDLVLDDPPAFAPPERIALDPVYRWMQATWIAQQLPLALALYALGGWGWTVWGTFVRVAVSVLGHWGIGHLAHRDEPGDWRVEGAAVQGRNVPVAALLTFGECWHDNHHAFPGSARLGLLPGQLDPGWTVLRAMAALGWVRELRLPADLPARPEVSRVAA